MRWIEIWESRAATDRRWVMIDAQGQADEVEYSCYHTLAIGSGAPIYIKDDQLIPVQDAQQLFSEIQNHNLVDQSELYVSGRECAVQDADVINGVEAQKCTFENQDAANLFLIKPPATSIGELWTAAEGGYSVRYRFSAQGTNGTVEHRYEAVQPPTNFSISLPTSAHLTCFEGDFPIPDGGVTLASGLNFATIESDSDTQTLQRFYDEKLFPAWESAGNSPTGGRLYSRMLDNGTECRVNLNFGRGRDDKTLISADVYPQSVNVESFQLPNDLASPVVIQAAKANFLIAGGVQNALDELVPDFEESGWVVREELSDVREDSAFVTLKNDAENTEMHIIVDRMGTNARVNIQTRDPFCGPRF